MLRAFIALGGIKPVGEKLEGMGDLGLGDPIGSIGVLVDYVADRVQARGPPGQDQQGPRGALRPRRRRLRPGQAAAPASTEKLIREHKQGIVQRQFAQKRLADAVADIFAQVAVLSRVSSIFEDQGVEASGQERFIADTFCSRAAARVEANFDQIESNDDDRMTSIAKLAYKRGEYGYALFED